ncbi:DUF317 domain-containing protein [Streptomyces sp. NBC_00024]|uniref:DUF317 domain-containing protein n=1 Tax=Streptomyces sp. NBC_00024 TaxID=2903612 RepID=UPI00386CB5D9
MTATSPDRLARLEYRPPSSFGGVTVARDEAWRARILAAPDARRALWEADFHSATPAHLVAAFATALADPRPPAPAEAGRLRGAPGRAGAHAAGPRPRPGGSRSCTGNRQRSALVNHDTAARRCRQGTARPWYEPVTGSAIPSRRPSTRPKATAVRR